MLNSNKIFKMRINVIKSSKIIINRWTNMKNKIKIKLAY